MSGSNENLCFMETVVPVCQENPVIKNRMNHPGQKVWGDFNKIFWMIKIFLIICF